MSNKRNILVVEDEKHLQEIMLQMLRTWDYEPVLANNSETALNIVRRQHPDLIIIDSTLPTINGFELCKQLKNDFLTAYIPVILLIEKHNIRSRILEVEKGVDDYIIKPPDPIDLRIRIEMALRRAEHQFNANSLTKLPGNTAIEKKMQQVIKTNEFFSVCYYDIDNFKSFNDKYGYLKGDYIIHQTANIISNTVKEYGNPNDFVGHIGGDDFIVITTPHKEETICQKSIAEFDRLIPFHYSKEDRDKGYIINKNRRGIITKVPIMSLSIAIANNTLINIESCIEISEITSEVKKYIKQQKGSNYMANRRGKKGNKTISDKNAESTKNEDKQKFIKSNFKKIKKENKKPLGQLFLENNLITEQQLNKALKKQWSTGQLLGEVILDMGLVEETEIARLLDIQQK